MGTIYRNGVPFVGSGGAGGVEMTMAEYELLPESEKMNGAIYFITDGDVSYPSASQMRYDNTESQIPSTTVQGAIDENRIEINDLKSGLTSFGVRILQVPYTIAGGSSFNTNIKTLIDANLPSGTKCLGIVGFSTSHVNVSVTSIRYENSSYGLQLTSSASSQITNNALVYFLYCRS